VKLDRICRAAALSLALAVVVPPASPQAPPTGTAWKLIWNDEFNGAAGTQPDSTKWTYDLGAGGWGNQELEDYTNAAENAHMDGAGHLDIHVENPSQGVYTSARMKTEGLFAVEYGRIEARIKLPAGQGIWPAFWTLGSDIDSISWPACGEIDIMENVGKTPAINYGSVHSCGVSAQAGPCTGGDYNVTAQYTLPSGQVLSDDFHTFAIEWSTQQITFYVDGNSYQTITQTDAGSAWVFNTPFFVILNVAVGGDFPGPPDSTTKFPQDMLVDYVRVFQGTNATAPAINTGGIVDAATGKPALTPGGLASIYGPSLAASVNDATFTEGGFPESVSGVSVFVNGAASPLTYLSPEQINFAVPWSSLVGQPLNVEVMLNNVVSNAVPVTLSSTAPSLFSQNGVAIVTCPNGSPAPGEECTLWGNGFGPAITPLEDGAPAPSSPLPRTANTCTLTIGGAVAVVDYCGAAPGLVIYQLNFFYPMGASVSGSTSAGVLTIDGNTANFVLPAP
jgi:uncharacterized protein (TIGR03437 family)